MDPALPAPTFEIPPSMGFQLLEKNDTGEFLVPSGWSIVGFHEMNDPGVQAAFQDLVKGPEDMDKYNTGQMKLLRMGGDNGGPDTYKVIRVDKPGDFFDVPWGWSIVEMDESNFGEYMPKVGHLIDPSMAEGMENGTIKFIVDHPSKNQRFCGTEDGQTLTPLME